MVGIQAQRISTSHEDSKPVRRQSTFMRYATDNRLVRAIYSLITGPYRTLFYAALAVIAIAYVYFPVRDLYIAKRTGDLVSQQLSIRQNYNDELSDDVSALLSEEGIEDIARKEFGMVKEGERPLTVTGTDDDLTGTSASDTTSAEVESAEQAVYDDSPWYYKVLDMLFFYTGVEGQTVVSAGTSEINSSSASTDSSE